MPPMRVRKRRRGGSGKAQVLLASLLLFLAAAGVAASEVKISRLQSQTAFLQGTLEAVSVDPLGTLRLAARAERLTAISEPFVLSAAAHPRGWVVGTGNGGRVLLVGRDGAVEELFQAPEPEVFAVWADAQGAVYAGTSPRGKVYRIAGGEGRVFFDPGETYIWRIEGYGEGELLVATGTQGKLYRVGPDGAGSVWWDSDDTHLRALEVLDDGTVLVGTAGEGLVVRLDADGAASTLYDAPQPEVVDFAPRPGGGCFAAVVASEASRVDLAAKPREATSNEEEGEEGEKEKDAAEVVVEETVAGHGMVGSRPPGFQGARSVLLSISPSGSVEEMWSFQEDTVFSLLWHRDRLWIGTGLEGKVYSFRERQLVLENDVEERQVVALVPDGTHPAFATTNAGAFFRLVEERQRTGTYTSPVLDGGQVSRFGNLYWRGMLPKGSSLKLSFRSGISSEPDGNWTPWSSPREGREISLAAAPRGRYFQWRAELVGRDGASPIVAGVEVSYLQENLRPQIESFEAMAPGQILVALNFIAASQVYEPAHPNREGIFTTVESAAATDDGRLKTLWKKGFLTLRWKASDANGDRLVYALSVRQEDEEAWLPVVEDLEEAYYSFDATVLPDGLYRFRLEASDQPSNPELDALSAERISEPVVVDHAPPSLAQARLEGSRLEAKVEDELSPLREAVYSIDAGKWRPAEVADGLLDGRQEVVRLEVPAGARLVLLRLTDAAFNSATADVSKEVE